MKKKRDNSILCYIGLFVLIVLLLLPPSLRLFGKNLYEEKEETTKEIVTILSCNKQNETISSTFLNDEPQNISYRIKGNHLTKEEDATETDEESFIDIIRPYSKISYNESNSETSFSVQTSDLKGVKNYAAIFNSLENQLNYYNSQSFYCEKSSYEYK